MTVTVFPLQQIHISKKTLLVYSVTSNMLCYS